VTSSRGLKATESIVKYLEKIDRPESDEDVASAADSTALARVKREAAAAENNFDDLTVFDVSQDDSTVDKEDKSDFFDPDDDFGKL